MTKNSNRKYFENASFSWNKETFEYKAFESKDSFFFCSEEEENEDKDNLRALEFRDSF